MHFMFHPGIEPFFIFYGLSKAFSSTANLNILQTLDSFCDFLNLTKYAFNNFTSSATSPFLNFDGTTAVISSPWVNSLLRPLLIIDLHNSRHFSPTHLPSYFSVWYWILNDVIYFFHCLNSRRLDFLLSSLKTGLWRSDTACSNSFASVRQHQSLPPADTQPVIETDGHFIPSNYHPVALLSYFS